MILRKDSKVFKMIRNYNYLFIWVNVHKTNTYKLGYDIEVRLESFHDKI